MWARRRGRAVHGPPPVESVTTSVAEPPAEDQDGADQHERDRHDQPTDLRRDHVDATEQRQQAAEDGLPAPAATGRRPGPRR